MTNLYDLKCIKVDHTTTEGEQLVTYISFNQFESSFIKERWTGERRYNKEHTLFGHVHTKTIVTNPFDGKKSRRTFTFPSSPVKAEQIHKEQTKGEF